ncbi:MAG: hypothetical protein FH756_00370 [Firmicutes bacterium]|nr:hypothetical protein [Bacillota bacterium]
MVQISLIILITGIVILTTVIIYSLLQHVSKTRPAILNRIKKIRRKPKRRQGFYDWLPVIGALTGIASSIMLMWGSTTNMVAMQVTMFVGIAIGYMAKTLLRKENRYRSLREASTFFKAVGVRLKAGYNVPYTLRMAVTLTPSLRPPVQRCLQRWSFDPRTALEDLREEINIPEAETLSYVLLRAYESGGENVAHVLNQGARNIDYKLASMEEKSFAVGKMRILLWRVLPAMSIFGLFAGNFAYYAQNVLFDAISNIK